VTGATKNTVAKLLGDVGRVCMAYHDERVRGLKSKRIVHLFETKERRDGEGRP
jgi:hypothetical protein